MRLLLLLLLLLLRMMMMTIVVQAGLFYRAVRMHLRLYNWDRCVMCDM
jgi:hypothetical protein